jgi:hypothetical protein
MKTLILAAAVVIIIALSAPWVQATSTGLTADMIRTALSSANISTAPGSSMKLLDRSTGTWHDFQLRKLSVRASGDHATIDIDVTKIN